jgi:hypothetical protein
MKNTKKKVIRGKITVTVLTVTIKKQEKKERKYTHYRIANCACSHHKTNIVESPSARHLSDLVAMNGWFRFGRY